MKKIFIVTIQKPTGEQTLELGAKIIGSDKKETDIVVSKIVARWKTVRVLLSDGKELIFRGFPYILVKKRV